MAGSLRQWLIAVALVASLAVPARAEPAHGLSAFGDLKYPPDFASFDYVDPQAPKGGRMWTIGTGALTTFNSFNAYILKGDAAQGLGLLFDTLMTRAFDEPDAVYGLIAHSAEIAEDGKGVTFYLREEARFADGTPVRAADVVFTLEILKAQGHIAIAQQLRDVAMAEAVDPLTVRYTFRGEATRDLPLVVATLPVFSQEFYQSHDFTKADLTPPLGSGPYRIGDFAQGQFVTYARREDYWGWHLPVNQGRFNFDELRYEYFRDHTTAFEAFKAGEFDLREEFTSKRWATGYDLPAIKEGLMVRDLLPDDRPSGAQGFFINTRRAKFRDRRVRRALDHAFDFEWSNRNLFHGHYLRSHSFFENSDLKAKGPPSREEIALLEPFRADLPEEVFEEPYVPPASDGSGRDRNLLRKADELLNDAGWTVQDGIRVNAEGKPLKIEFLITSSAMARVIGPYARNLERLGIKSSIRRIDATQYQERVKSYDFDITVRRYVMSSTPGPELRSYFCANAANAKGSLNISGITNPAVDALVENVIAAETRDELKIAARALDRVLRAENYWVPNWYKDKHTVAYWNKYSRPKFKPKYSRGIIDTWWYDRGKAARIKLAQ